MDASLLASAGVSTTTMAVLFIAYKVFQAIRGHRLVSDCCGRRGEVGFDVRDMPPTPPEETGNRQSVPPLVGVKPESLSVRVPEPTEHQKGQETA
jgi:hypothetical protein